MSFIKKHKNDLALILALLIVAGAVWAYMIFTRRNGGYVVAEINGQEVARIPISENTQLVLGEGEHTNTLVIEDGEAFISSASCPDHVCINQGKIRYDGEIIVCLPNKLIVSVTGGDESPVDAVTK